MKLHIYLHVIFLLCFSLLQLTIPTNALGNDTDRVALLNMKESIANDPQGIMSSWNDSIHFCNWTGITCSQRHGRVTVLALQDHDLSGSISPSIGNLTFLRFVNLASNSFFGKIPPEVGHLYRLQHLNLSHNMLGGKFPISLINCSELVTIDLNNNRFIGHIPSELGSLMKLEAFLVNSNNLTGGIPPSLGNLSSSFKFFSVGYNNLAGSIPNEIGRLRSLSFFAAPANDLSGMLPFFFYNLSSIRTISVASNKLSGTLPVNIGLSLPDLQILAIGGNKFSGSIPVSLSNASQLQMVDLALNNFVGPIPTNLGNLQDLFWLNLGENYLGSNSTSDWGFLKSLTNCSKLEKFSIHESNFGGVLPGLIGNLSTQLDSLYLGGNYIHGNIPSSLANLVKLNVLNMEYNLLTGAIPESLGKLQTLRVFTAYHNRLSGEIPSSLCNLTRLIRISLFDNRLEGNIPSTIGNYQQLQQLDFSNNNLTGNIPLEVFSLPSLSLLLNLSHNTLNGSLPVQVGKLNRLYTLDLSANNLSGEIPNTIGDCSNLDFLSLRSNFFQGNITSSLSSIKGLVHLDLSQNNLSGEIPKELQNLTFLGYLNISANDLEGEVPRGGVFRNVSAVSFTGNSKLCGGVPTLQLPACPTKGSKSGKSQVLKLTIIIICVILVLILSFSFSYALYRRRKSGEKSSSPKISAIEFLSKVSYRALFEATSGFSPNNLLGYGSFGSVYKAIIDEEEKDIFAVKVLKLEKKGASKGFIAECKALKNIRHRNLVKILTVCSSVDYNGNDFKALVFEFMENGTLEEWMHWNKEDENRRNLNLLQRINILMDVASALDYLHEECEQPIIHCDVKPSNVLLDKDMVAHLSDFGLARLLSNTKGFRQSQTSTVGIKGSIGYAAPEYGMGGEASKQGDIYSYGILVLEILTARRPTDEMFKDGLNLHNFVKTALPLQLTQIVDPILLSREVRGRSHINNGTVIKAQDKADKSESLNETDANVEKCLISLMKIGLACSMESPNERMMMKDVTRELHSIKNDFIGNGVNQRGEPRMTTT
ncbi:putative receptor-like protein kinase At3g47110 [Ziziphus jujuba]|uniref:Receptor-like protein kinase At3g47110 n=1 Tax=Ziziphus jujuba TaxID=326968 RepID=A0ABM3IEP7_ZIZJJ|nr:putative receptor-like protein kinase At3g47110 [Ziziphus jujuba]